MLILTLMYSQNTYQHRYNVISFTPFYKMATPLCFDAVGCML